MSVRAVLSRPARSALLSLILLPGVLAAQESSKPVPPQTFDWAASRSIPAKTPWGQAVDVESTRKILSWTTMPEYTNALVDHLPADATVVSPTKHFGDPIGKPGVLHDVAQIYGYFRALAASSPRVNFEQLGETEEGHHLALVQVGSAANLARLEEIRQGTNHLSDPRTTTPQEADHLIATLPVIYGITAGLHSAETGPPEMVMEMAYRLAVSNDPVIREIRDSVVVFIVPVTEPDGRDRVVDWIRKMYPTPDTTKRIMGPPYWGKYIFHDNNRDGLQMSARLTQEVVKLFLKWRYPVGHDLHESVPYLYTSTGTGPYNPTVDPITIGEWQWFSNYEVTAMTALGMPGVWTHGFYDGWNPTYLLWVTNTRNAMGRFYETFGNMLPWTRQRTLGGRQTSVEWYRPLPPRDTTMWSLRDNTNYMETGLLTALSLTARNRTRVLREYWTKANNSLDKGRTDAPFAYVVPQDQARRADARYMLELLERQGIEVSVATADFTTDDRQRATEADTAAGDGRSTIDDRRGSSGAQGTGARSGSMASAGVAASPRRPVAPSGERARSGRVAKAVTVHKGDYVIRMDQPFRNFILTLMQVQHFPSDAPRPYDDVAWTFPLMFNVTVETVADSAILAAPMERATAVRFTSPVASGGSADWWVVEPSSSAYTMSARLGLGASRVWAVEDSLVVGEDTLAPGAWLVRARDRSASDMQKWADTYGLTVRGAADDAVSDAPRHELDMPRIAILHSWRSTQQGGWVRYTFDTMGIPYTYVGVDVLRSGPDLRKRYDVILFPDQGGTGKSIFQGIDPEYGPLPYETSKQYPALGKPDATSDMTGGMGYAGLHSLQRFVQDGGTFITLRAASLLPVDMGLVRGVDTRSAGNLFVPGSLVKGVVAARRNPLTYGYDDTMPLHHRFGPYLRVSRDLEGDIVLKYAKANELFLSGLVENPGGLAGQPALLSVPSGRGHYVLFAFNPIQRFQNFADFAFVWNAIMNWNDL
jgi:hypothetical protein